MISQYFFIILFYMDIAMMLLTTIYDICIHIECTFVHAQLKISNGSVIMQTFDGIGHIVEITVKNRYINICHHWKIEVTFI